MKEKQLTIKSRISEVNRSLKGSIKYAVYNRQKVHITAPTSVGKTRLGIETIGTYVKKGYSILVLAPQISITSQVKVKLDKKGIPSYVYNSTTWQKLSFWEFKNRKKWTDPILSTIDSAHYRLDQADLDPHKTIVIIDEPHTFLQKARKNFDDTVRAINELGCPVLAFTATESAWVINYLFQFDQVIRVHATELPEKRINPFLINGSIPYIIAEAISENDYKKLIIWTETIAEQNRIADEIKRECPHKKVLTLNAETKETTEKEAWDYIMKNDKLPRGTNVAIFNGVFQAGININDDDIDYQYLVGQFDPMGFLQYIGRARNYEGEFNYLYHNFKNQSISLPTPSDLENQIILLEQTLQQFSEEQLEVFGINTDNIDLYSYSDDDEVIINKCMVANRIYDKSRELSGLELLVNILQYDPDVVIREETELRGDSDAKSKKKYRKSNRDKLPKLIKQNAISLKRLTQFYKPGMRHDVALKIVDESVSNKKEAKDNDLLYVAKTRKLKLRKTIETAKKSSVSIQQVLMAATNYLNKGKNEAAIKDVLKLSGGKIKKLLAAEIFYSYSYTQNKIFRKVLNAFNSNILECKLADDWKLEIQSIKSNLITKSTAAIIYDNCFVTKRSKYKNDNGDMVNGQKLISIVRTFDEYKKENGLDFI